MTDHIDTDGVFEEEPEPLPPVAPEIQAYLNASKEMLKEAFDRIPEPPRYGAMVFPTPPEMEFEVEFFEFPLHRSNLKNLLNSGWRIHTSIPCMNKLEGEVQILFILVKEKESKPDANNNA